jgi:hypothetical protein
VSLEPQSRSAGSINCISLSSCPSAPGPTAFCLSPLRSGHFPISPVLRPPLSLPFQEAIPADLPRPPPLAPASAASAVDAYIREDLARGCARLRRHGSPGRARKLAVEGAPPTHQPWGRVADDRHERTTVIAHNFEGALKNLSACTLSSPASRGGSPG